MLVVFSRVRRMGVVVLALMVGIPLTACTARGGGRLGDPLASGLFVEFQGKATFGFTLTCEIKNRQKAVVRGQLSYQDQGSSQIELVDNQQVPTGAIVGFPAFKIHGELDPMIIDAATCEDAEQLIGVPGQALFKGRYRAEQGATARSPGHQHGRFTVQVSDFGEPARPGGGFEGDGFAIQLEGGTFGGYTRGGFLEGGNVQVD